MSYHNPKHLPQGLHSTFKSIFKLYEQKQYKRSLKAAETILRDHPTHGETLSMKALALHSMNKKKESYACARKGLASDLQSHVCWHVLGILYRGDRHYLDAAKCYENALLHQKDNQQIVRDLTLMHIQNRNYEANMKLRNKALTDKPGQKQNWFGFAVACHLAGDLEKALSVVDAYATVQEKENKEGENKNQAEEKYEKSEMIFYKNLILEETGDFARALKHLEEVAGDIVDKEEYNQKRADYYYKLGNLEEALNIYRALIKSNPENWKFHSGLLACLQIVPLGASLWNSFSLSAELTNKVVKLYDEFRTQFPRAASVKLIPMSFISGEQFQNSLKKFLEAQLSKAVPSVFNTVKHLYKNSAKVPLITKVLLAMEEALKGGKFAKDQELLEPPSTILCLHTFLAQHYCHIGEHTKAIQYVELCQKHTPTVLDFETLKATIYKSAGNPALASKHMEEAQSMDLADRYLNTKNTRYFLRADYVTKAQENIALFTKPDNDNSSSAYNNIFDMQVMWYEYEEGCSWLRQKEYGKALKKFVDTEKHFLDIQSDQLDFHSYCLRKMTLRQYLKMLRFEDKIFGHQFYVKAALQIVKTYLYLHDHPLERSKEEEEAFLATMSTEEQKKYLRKKKQKEAKKAKEEEEKKAQQQKSSQPKKGKPAPVDEDPNGLRYLNVTNKIDEAHSYLKRLVLYANDNLETHLLNFEVAMRRKKYLVALNAVLKGRELAPGHPDVHRITVKLFATVDNDMKPLVKQILQEEQKTILGTQTLVAFNEAFKKEHGASSVAARHSYTESAILLTPGNKEALLKALHDDDFKNDKSLNTLSEAIQIHTTLAKHSPALSASYITKSKARFPFSTYFAPVEDDEDKKEQAKSQ